MQNPQDIWLFQKKAPEIIHVEKIKFSLIFVKYIYSRTSSSQFWNETSRIQSAPHISHGHHPLDLQARESLQRLQEKFLSSESQQNSIFHVGDFLQMMHRDESLFFNKINSYSI